MSGSSSGCCCCGKGEFSRARQWGEMEVSMFVAVVFAIGRASAAKGNCEKKVKICELLLVLLVDPYLL